MSEVKPVGVPLDVLEGLEAVRRHAGTDVLDVAIVRYLAIERGQPALAVWVNKHPDEYGRGLLDGYEAVGGLGDRTGAELHLDDPYRRS
jgi:hypothetical protein